MAGNAPRSFQAVLEPMQYGLGWVVVRVPFVVESAWKNMVRLRITVEVGGERFRTSLFSCSGQPGHFIAVNKKMQRAAGARVGAMVDFTVAPDLDDRIAIVPPELIRLLKAEKKLSKWFDTLSESTRHEMGKWIEGVASPKSRQRRAAQMAERLMLTMEGEKELPPILQLTFRNTPAARRGWNAMTPAQRRSHLLAVFSYQSPDARTKRIQKLIEAALRVADN